jgi:hypothetical protein
MRRRGLPESYYSRGDMGIQKGFEALLAGDVSSTELEDRIVTAQDRVLNANPEIASTTQSNSIQVFPMEISWLMR